MKMAVHSVGTQLPAAVLRKKRRQIYKEKTAKRAFINLILQVLFAMLVFSISYMSRDERAYLLKANIENQLYISSKYQFGFSKVSTFRQKWLCCFHSALLVSLATRSFWLICHTVFLLISHSVHLVSFVTRPFWFH